PCCGVRRGEVVESRGVAMQVEHNRDETPRRRPTPRTPLSRPLLVLGVTVGLVLVALGAGTGAAKSKPGEIQAVSPPAVEPTEFNGDVRKLKSVAVRTRGDFEGKVPKSKKHPPGPVVGAPAIPGAPSVPATTQNFSGLGFASMCDNGATLCGAGWPPDPVG